MLVKITLYDNTVYKFASKTTDTSDGLYLGRLREELSLSSKMTESGSALATQNLTIYNGDNYIPRSKNFWGASLLLTQDNGLTWLGKITFFNFDADGNLYITASEKGAPELELQLPDEVRQVYTVDENFHQSSTTMTIPLVVGGTHSNPVTLSTILIDKTRGIYLICVGEIREIVAVYNGSEVLPRSAYIPYKGWSTQAEHPGFAYVQIEEPYRTNADGSYAEINVDVVGLKLGEHTDEECRNGARFLYYFLTTPSSGVNGWGCGISTDEIDMASFTSAISKVDLMGLKLDGVMWLRQSAQSWIDQICQAIHGSYSIGANGKRKLFIDYAGAASKKTFNANKITLNKYGKDSYANTVYNKGILSYGYNPITGLFMQSAQFENSASIAQIGEQKFVGESYLINDAATALAVLEYTCKRSLSSAEAVDFTTDDLTTDLFAGDIITIDRTDLGISGEFQIASISTSDVKSEITAVRFDPSVFTVTGSHSNVNWADEKQISSSVIPGTPTNLNLSTDCEIMSDGTANVYINGTFTVPNGGWLFAAVQYGEGASPEDWTELSLIENGAFRIASLKPAKVYSVRVRMVTATGHSDYVSSQIRTAGDSDAPSEPTCTAATYLKTVRITVTLANPPADLAGFEIWRSNIEGNPGSKISYIAATSGSATYVDIEAADYFTNFYYSAIAVDKWGNRSGYSNQAVANCSKIQAHEVEADWVISNLMETARGVGADVNGIKIDYSGIEGWYNGNRYIDLNTNGGSTIAGWNIGTNSLYNNNIELVSSGVARTMDFVSGHKGWQIDSNGKAEFQDATIRGTMTSVNFVKDTVSAVGGSLMILGAAEVQSFTKTTQNYQTILTEDCLDLATENGDVIISEQSDTSVYYNITVDNASTFNGGDILRIRNAETVQDLWLGVASKSSNTLSCVMLYGTAMNLESGMCVVNYRRAGNGGINLNGTSPSIDLYNHNGKPWAGTNLLARIGNLNGVNGITDDRYGFFFGNSDRSVAGRHYITWNEISNELEISGKLKAATGTFSGELVAASGSFSGEVSANSGNIGGFVLNNGILSYNKNDVDFDEGYIIIQNPHAIVNGTDIGSIKSGISLCGTNVEANLANIGKGYNTINVGINLDSSSIRYGSIETAYTRISNNQLNKSECNICNGYIDLAGYSRSSASGAWGKESSTTISTNAIVIDWIAGNNLVNSTLDLNPLYIRLTDNISRVHSILEYNSLSIGDTVYLKESNGELTGRLDNVHTFYIVGHGNGDAGRITMNLDSSYSQYIATVEIDGSLRVTGTIGSNTLTTGTVSASSGVLTGSAEESKTNIKNVSVLDRLKSLRVMQWNYKTDLDTLHIGPMAKDFNATFKVNKESGENINYTDSIGVALRAIQELAAKVDELEARLCQTGY